MTPWSVRPRAGWPKAAARSARRSILQAPSSSEYSEWTCRWAQVGAGTGRRMLGGGPDTERARGGSLPLRARIAAARAVDPPAQQAHGVEIAADGDPAGRRGVPAQQGRQGARAGADDGVGGRGDGPDG